MVEPVENLTNKPLIEAIFEIRWQLEERAKGFFVDPHYKLLVGRIYDKLRERYPIHKSLPSATMPDEVAANIVQHQFRASENGWPLVQLGPGVATLNDTAGYLWPDFSERIQQLMDMLFDTYPQSENNLKIHSLLLRYIDAEPFDYSSENVWDYIGDKLKVKIDVYRALFEGTEVEEAPSEFDLRFAFPSSNPKGDTRLRLAKGTTNGRHAIIWETHVQSKGDDVPTTRGAMSSWVQDAHRITHDWFFKMVEGDLLEKYK